MESLSGKIAVVTGASSGIGKAITLSLAKEGAVVCLIGRRVSTLEEIRKDVGEEGKRLIVHKANLEIDEEIQSLVNLLERSYEGIDVLVHSAGIISLGEIAVAGINDFDRQYKVNVRVPYLLTQSLLPMIKSRNGQVVFINSSVGLHANAGVGQYAATKHGLKAIADSLREEVNTDGLRILSVFLGRTATPMQEKVHKMEGKAYHPDRLMQPEDVATVVINALRLPRTAEVTDIYIRPLYKP